MMITVSRTRLSIVQVPSAELSAIYADMPAPGIIAEGARPTPANLVWLYERYPQAGWVDPEGLLLEARAFSFIQRQDRPAPGDYEAAFPFKLPPLPFQLEIFAAARHMTEIALAPVAMGTGKTKMSLDIAADKFLRDEIDTLVVVAPNGVHKQWVLRAIPEHLSAAVRYQAAVWSPTRKVPVMVGSPPASAPRRLRILTFNVESFSSESGKAFKAARAFMASGRCMFVFDESSRGKNHRAARSKAILKLRQYSVVRVNLSGTPITKGLEDLYMQYEYLSHGIINQTSFYSFRNRYCTLMPAFRGAAFGVVKVTGYRNVEELIRKIAPYTFVVPKDALGLPEKTYERRPVPMTDEQRKLYRAVRDELITDLRAHRIATPANAAVRLIRLQQIVCGHVIETMEATNEDGDDVTIQTSSLISSRRLEVLWDVLEQHSGPAVVWCRFTDDIKDVQSFLEENGKRVVSYYGGTSNADREEAVRAFKAGEVDYFVGNPAAAGTGLDGLQVAELAVYYSNGFNAENRWQSEDRIHRIGMRGRAHYVDLVTEDSVDNLILKNLSAKKGTARAVFENPSLLEQANEEETAFV